MPEMPSRQISPAMGAAMGAAIGRELARWGWQVPPQSVLDLCAARALDVALDGAEERIADAVDRSINEDQGGHWSPNAVARAVLDVLTGVDGWRDDVEAEAFIAAMEGEATDGS